MGVTECCKLGDKFLVKANVDLGRAPKPILGLFKEHM